MSKGQNSLCSNALPFCTDTVYNFPAGVNAGSAQGGPNYTCLGTQPNPAWYYLEVLNPGAIIINMTSTPAVDIDFTLWGPFTNPTTPCVAQLTAANTVDCSYSTSWNETATINNAQTGEVYILLITNYSNNPCNINFLQQNAGQSNAGSTNCGILAPPISNNGPLCEGETLEITVSNPNPNATYNWTGPNAFSSNQMNITIPNVTTANAGTYSLSITVSGQTSPAVTTIVEINPKPNVSLAAFQDVCEDTPDFTLTGGSPLGGIYSGTGVVGALFSPINAGIGTRTIKYVYETPEGCSDSATANIFVSANPTVIISNDTAICEQTSISLTASGGNSYAWSNNSFSPSILITPITTTTYSVTVTNTTGCSTTEDVVVTVMPLPIVSIKPEDPDLCIGESITFVAGSGSTYLWSSTPNDPSLNSQNTLDIITVQPTVSTTYTVTATDAYSCTSSISNILTINPKPVAAFYANPKTVNILEPIVNFFDNSQGAITWLWIVENGVYYSVPEFSHAFSDTGTYEVTLVISNQYGCFDSTHATVYVQPFYTIYIPNSFSPNNDLTNDVFYVYGEGILEIELWIYDRWGKQIFISDDINLGWDGKINGVDAPVGVYTYIISYKDGNSKTKSKKGSLTLIR